MNVCTRLKLNKICFNQPRIVKSTMHKRVKVTFNNLFQPFKEWVVSDLGLNVLSTTIVDRKETGRRLKSHSKETADLSCDPWIGSIAYYPLHYRRSCHIITLPGCESDLKALFIYYLVVKIWTIMIFRNYDVESMLIQRYFNVVWPGFWWLKYGL